MHALGTVIDFEKDSILLDGERIEKDWKPIWRAIKARLKKEETESRIPGETNAKRDISKTG